MAVQGADPDAGAAGDLLEADVRADLGERRLGRLDQALAIALAVRAGFPGDRRLGLHVHDRAPLDKRSNPPYIYRRHPPFNPAADFWQ